MVEVTETEKAFLDAALALHAAELETELFGKICGTPAAMIVDVLRPAFNETARAVWRERLEKADAARGKT
jgi:hypothetical protein